MTTYIALLRGINLGGPEVVRLVGRQLYVVYPNGIGRSTLSHTSLERTLGTPGTARNWNTVLKLDAQANGR